MESNPAVPSSSEIDSHFSQLAAPVKSEVDEGHRVSPASSTSSSKVTAVAIVAPTEHRSNDKTSTPCAEGVFEAGIKAQLPDDSNRETEEEETLRHQMQSLEVFCEQQKQMEEANR